MSLRLCVLASGSRGNSTYIETHGARLLVDAGLSWRELRRRMETRGLDWSALSALLITHKHTDHVRGLRVAAKRLGVPVYLSHGTRRTLGTDYPEVEFREFGAGEGFMVGDVRAQSFLLPHDGAETVGYTLTAGGLKVGLATDMGCVTRLAASRLAGSHLLVIESNHDRQMLMEGPYPWFLKRRIDGRHGHLSNDDAAALLDRLRHPGLKWVGLSHLSGENNTPEAALACVLGRLNGPEITVNLQHEPSPIITP